MKARGLIVFLSGGILFNNISVFADKNEKADFVSPSLSSPEPVELAGPPGDSKPVATNQVVSFKLKPTAIAPLGAGGMAELNANTLSIHLSHMDPGRFELVGVRRHGDLREHLCTVTIVDPTAAPDRQANDNKKEASAGPDQVRIDTEVRVTMPAGVALQDIKQLLFLNPRGNAVLTGDAEKAPDR